MQPIWLCIAPKKGISLDQQHVTNSCMANQMGESVCIRRIQCRLQAAIENKELSCTVQHESIFDLCIFRIHSCKTIQMRVVQGPPHGVSCSVEGPAPVCCQEVLSPGLAKHLFLKAIPKRTNPTARPHWSRERSRPPLHSRRFAGTKRTLSTRVLRSLLALQRYR